MSTEKTIDTTRGARGRASKKSIATRDVMTVAAMMVLTFLVCMVTGPRILLMSGSTHSSMTAPSFDILIIMQSNADVQLNIFNIYQL